MIKRRVCMAKIKIIADTGADIPKETAEKYDITVFPFMSIFGEEVYRSGEELSSEAFFEKLESSGIIPTTSQTPYVEMEETLRKCSAEYDSVIVFTLSSKASGQYNTLQMIKRDLLEENPNADIRIIDSMSFTIAIGMTVRYAAILAQNGASADEIEQKSLDYLNGWDMYFLVGTLDYLEKGGRINKASAVLGALLDIKPVLSIRGGLVEVVDKFRGKKNLVKKLIKKMKENPGFDPEAKQFGIVHANSELGEQMKVALKEEYPDCEIVMYNQLGAIIGTHTGPDVIAVFFRRKTA